MKRIQGAWMSIQMVAVRNFTCGFCDRDVASEKGWRTEVKDRTQLLVCPNCNRPTFIETTPEGDLQFPGTKPGRSIEHLPADVEQLYAEARSAMAANAPTVAILGFRKLLMHVAVEKGAAAHESFQSYVKFLEEENHVPSGAKAWVDHIRSRGNEANHEITMMSNEDATELLIFSEMLLRLVYEFPGKLPKKKGLLRADE